MNNTERIKKVINKAKNIIVSGHINPDGDSIGSLLALGLGLKKLGKKVYMLSVDGVPKRYKNLPGTDSVITSCKAKTDLAISVDCGSKELLGRAYSSFKLAENILEIDHHKTRSSFNQYRLVDSKASAVGEIIYFLLHELGINLNRKIAQNILTSIIVETNSFRLPNLRPCTFKVCADLLKTGIDFHRLTESVYWSKTKSAAVLSAKCVEDAGFLKGGKIAWTQVRERDFKKYRAADQDVETVPADLLSIDEVEIAIFFREKNKDILRVSLRSKGRYNLAKFAKKYKGGGHSDSAGCLLPNNASQVKKFLRSLERLVDKKKVKRK